MTVSTPAFFRTLSNARIFPDGSFSVRFETDAGDADDRIPTSALGGIIDFLISAAKVAAPDDGSFPAGIPPEAAQFPISVQGLGLGYGHTPAESLLWIRLAPCFALAFALDSKRLSELAHELSQILRTLAANPERAN